MLLVAGASLVTLAVLWVLVKVLFRVRVPQLGSMSEQWLAEQRQGHSD